MTEFRLGKKEAVADTRDLLFASYQKKVIKTPARFGYGNEVKEWGVLGNDRYGDCVLAGADHEHILWNTMAKHPVNFTAQNALSDYSAVTGFDPNDPSTDNGTYTREALDYRRATGMVDANGQRHKIDGYVAVEIGNWAQVLEAAYLFSAVGIGFQCPDYIFTQFDAGKPWTVLPGNHSIIGGHYVPVIGHLAPDMITVVTWGKRQQMSKAFFQKYCDEAYAIFSKEMILATGKDRHGFDFTALQNDLNNL